MIQQVKISFGVKPQEDHDSTFAQPPDNNNPYTKLTSVISGLNSNTENYCIVVQVTSAESLAHNIQLTKQLDFLLRQLTKRELEIFDLVVDGLSNKLIADKLFITIETVRSHRKNIVSKAGASSMEEIKTWLLKTKL